MSYIDDLNIIWETVKRSFSPKMIDSAIELWFGDMKLLSLDDNTITLSTDSELKYKIVGEKYIDQIREEFCKYLGFDVNVKLIFNGVPADIEQIKRNILADDRSIAEDDGTEDYTQNGSDPAKDIDEDDQKNTQKKPLTLGSTIAPFNFEYTFENFIVGNSNKFAFAVCTAVASRPAVDYNPLFIYGPSGLGKTHLLYAITNELKKKRPDINVIYIKGEDFTNQMIDSLSRQAMREFRDKYRMCDVLLIDDIQFIAGKVSTQEEFFHTFNALYEEQKQIILVSDRPPREIKTLEDRLKTRFEWGLIADIQPPDLELRIAIIKKKAEQVHLMMNEDVLTFLAENLRSNIRQIEGAIKKLSAMSFISGRDITIDVARGCITDLLGGAEPVVVTVEKIFSAVYKKYNIPKEEIVGKKRSKEIAFSRHVSIYLIRKITEMSLPNIGKIFERDHSTIMSSIDIIEKKLHTDSMFENELADIEKDIFGN